MKAIFLTALIAGNAASVFIGISTWPKCVERSFFQAVAVLGIALFERQTKKP